MGLKTRKASDWAGQAQKVPETAVFVHTRWQHMERAHHWQWHPSLQWQCWDHLRPEKWLQKVFKSQVLTLSPVFFFSLFLDYFWSSLIHLSIKICPEVNNLLPPFFLLSTVRLISSDWGHKIFSESGTCSLCTDATTQNSFKITLLLTTQTCRWGNKDMTLHRTYKNNHTNSHLLRCQNTLV